jgi:hypothetical protein
VQADNPEEVGTELQPDVDDTDGLDPALEFDEWRARELARLLRDKKAQAERDAEQEEIERRRALPEEQRMAEDMAFAEQTRAREKGQMGFMQKYYHRGVFHAVSPFHFEVTPLMIGWRCGRTSQSRLHGRYGVCGRYVDAAKSHASQKLWKGEHSLSILLIKPNNRHHVQSTPILPTKIHRQEDGVTQQNNPWVDPERWERQKQDAGIVEVHIRGKIVLITISTTRWLLYQATRADRDRGRTGDMVNKTEGKGAVLLEGIGIRRAMRSRARRGVSMKRGQGTRGTLEDQRDRRKRGIGRDIEVGVRVARGIGMEIVGEMTVNGIVSAIGTVIGETGIVTIRIEEGIRLVILYIRDQFSEHVSIHYNLPPYLVILYPHSFDFLWIKPVMPSSSLPELHCRLYR